MFAAIYIPDFPLEAVLRAEPELREQAVAVLDGKPPVLTVISANTKARTAGADVGMTALEASLVEGLEVRRRSPSKEAAAHAALLDCAQAFSPRVEDTACDTVVVDIAGLERLFGAAPKLARELARRASELGLETNVATAANADTAMHAARGFAGITVIPPGREAERLGELPVEVLFCAGDPAKNAELLETLDRWGVRTLRALAALPEIALSERLGQDGIHLQKIARGATARTLVPAGEPLEFFECMELEDPLDTLEPLAFILSRLLEQLCARLGARALATNELRLQLDLDVSVREDEHPPRRHGDREKDVSRAPDPHSSKPDKSTIEKSPSVPLCLSGGCSETRNAKHETIIRLPVPMLDSRIFLKLLQLDLKAHSPQAPVVKVRIDAEPAPPRSAQTGLFLPVAPEPERLELLLARLAGVVRPVDPPFASRKGGPPTNEERVGSAELLDTHHPDAFRMRKFSPPVPGTTLNAKRDTRNAKLAFRRFRPPLAATVELRDGDPVHVWIKDKTVAGAISASSGPWRTSGEWWKKQEAGGRAQDAGKWNREEWDVAVMQKTVGVAHTTRGSSCGNGTSLYRIFRDLATGHWFVEGTYD
jgi:protein ImuB